MQPDKKTDGSKVTKEWIDPTCQGFNKLTINQHIAKANQSFVDIFGKDKIKGGVYRYRFTLHKLGKDLAIGIVDIQNKKLFGAELNKNRVTYNCYGYYFDGKAEKFNQGAGFKAGQTVIVTTDLNTGTVEWRVGDQVRYKATAAILTGTNITWVPLICLGQKQDAFQIIM